MHEGRFQLEAAWGAKESHAADRQTEPPTLSRIPVSVPDKLRPGALGRHGLTCSVSRAEEDYSSSWSKPNSSTPALVVASSRLKST
jgi:hypothetical protein